MLAFYILMLCSEFKVWSKSHLIILLQIIRYRLLIIYKDFNQFVIKHLKVFYIRFWYPIFLTCKIPNGLKCELSGAFSPTCS